MFVLVRNSDQIQFYFIVQSGQLGDRDVLGE
jgi:hypothetical protein